MLWAPPLPFLLIKLCFFISTYRHGVYFCGIIRITEDKCVLSTIAFSMALTTFYEWISVPIYHKKLDLSTLWDPSRSFNGQNCTIGRSPLILGLQCFHIPTLWWHAHETESFVTRFVGSIAHAEVNLNSVAVLKSMIGWVFELFNRTFWNGTDTLLAGFGPWL